MCKEGVVAVKLHFTVKDARQSLITAIGEILEQELVQDGISAFTYAAGGYMLKCTTSQKHMRGVVAVNLRFNVTSAGRKAFAKAVGEILGCEAIYCGTPSFAYAVGRYFVDREGVLICPADADTDEADRLIAALSMRGYEMDKESAYSSENETLANNLHKSDDDPNRLLIDMPLNDFTDKAIENLREIVASKNRLIKKALAADSLRIDVTDDKLRFPWFTLTGTDGEIDSYLRFVTALCKMAKEQKRVTAKEHEVENDKFTMRLFLIRLGFVGPEYKTARKILLRNLSGNTAWKDGQNPAQTKDVGEP
jgi:hypothetical protein